MSGFVPGEKATTIRMPSTANLMVDSVDRPKEAGVFLQPNWDFQITKNQAILNGFFTRIGVTEAVLEWKEPNINKDASGVRIDCSGVATTSTADFFLPVGFYTISDALDTLVSTFNALPSATRSGVTLAITSTGGVCSINATNGGISFPFTLKNVSGILTKAGFTLKTAPPAYLTTQTALTGTLPKPVPRYIDFVSPQLTYNQELKDSATQQVIRDVLLRWYFAKTDDTTQVDKYGYVIYPTYKPFYTRRLFNPPKQIKWDSTQPLGNISFQVYDEDGALFKKQFDFLLTLQVSEV